MTGPGRRPGSASRLAELGYGIPDGLRLVPDDFETDGFLVRPSWPLPGSTPPGLRWWPRCGVSMYLTGEANRATLRQLAALAPGSTVVMTFQPPLELLEAAERTGRSFAENGARASGTPFISFYSPAEIQDLARAAGFAEVRHVSAAELNERYFSGRADGLHTTSGEELLVAVTGPGRGR